MRVESSVNLDASGNRDPYYVSLDLATARHPQTLLATHFNGQPLTVEHGAPLRLLVPVKLGLKNVKAITKLTYVAEEPTNQTTGPNVAIPATTESNRVVTEPQSHQQGEHMRSAVDRIAAFAAAARREHMTNDGQRLFKRNISGQPRLRHRCAAGTALPGTP